LPARAGLLDFCESDARTFFDHRCGSIGIISCGLPDFSHRASAFAQTVVRGSGDLRRDRDDFKKTRAAAWPPRVNLVAHQQLAGRDSAPVASRGGAARICCCLGGAAARSEFGHILISSGERGSQGKCSTVKYRLFWLNRGSERPLPSPHRIVSPARTRYLEPRGLLR
jgi:hypothetical protein